MLAENGRLTRKEFFLALFVFVITLTAHLFRLNYWTPLPDEINYALSARYLVTHRTPIGNDIMFFPPLFVYIAALLQKSGSELLLSVRLISAVAGALLLASLYFALRSHYRQLTALITTGVVFSLFAFHLYSRLGQVEILLLMFIVFSITSVLYKKPFWAGLFLGMALWVKETALGVLLSFLIFYLLQPTNRKRSIALFFAGLAAPVILLITLGYVFGQNLLFEISASRGYDINMLKLSPFANFIATGANLSFNLFPRLFYKWEFLTFILFAPLTTLFFLSLTIFRAVKFRPFPLLVTCYLLVHLTFFFFFSRKFDYYFLPAALLITAGGTCELFEKEVPTRLRFIGKVLVSLLVIFNIYANSFLYFNRGTHQSFETAISKIPARTAVATSHPTLVAYLAQRARKYLEIVPLFEPRGYHLNQKALTDSTVTAVIVKKYYFDRLRNTYPIDWDSLLYRFPVQEDHIDSTWSLWLITKNQIIRQSSFLKSLAEFAKTTGVVILRRASEPY